MRLSPRALLSRLTGKRLVAILLLVATSTGVVAGLLQLRSDTRPESFLPQDDRSLTSLEDAAKSFGGDPIVAIAESPQPRDLLGPDQLPKLLVAEGKLARTPDVAAVYGPGTVLNQIAGSAQNLVATLAGRRDALAAQAEQQALGHGASDQQAKKGRDDAVRAFDQRYGALLVRGLPAGLPTLRNPKFAEQVIFDQTGAPRPQWAFVVPKPNAVAILVRPREGLDQKGTERLVDAVRSSLNDAGLNTTQTRVTGVPAVTAELGRQTRWAIPFLGALAVILITACYVFVPWIRPKRYRLIPILVTLSATAIILAVFGWLNHPLSLGVIAFLPILVGIASDYPAYLTHPGRRRRVMVAALASSAAFASLAISPLPFVRDLGLALAGGLLIALGLGLVIGRRLNREADPVVRTPPAEPESSNWSARRNMSMRKRAAALAAVLAVASFGWITLPQVHIEAQPDRLAAGLPALRDVNYAQQMLGGSGEVQLVMHGPNVLSPEALEWMNRAEDEIALRHGGQMKPVLSPSSLFSFLGPSPTAEQVTAGTQILPKYLTNSVVRDDHQRAAMSYLIQLQDLRDQKDLLHDVRSVIPDPPPGYGVELVGLPVVAARGYDVISQSPYLSSTVGILSAGLVLLVGLRRSGDALRAVLAAALATGWGLAAVAVLGISLTPLTLALGSLTTATACEFTVMLGDSIHGRRRKLYRTVLAAATAAALGYAALAASTLEIVREFGLLLAVSVGLSFLAGRMVLVFFPRPFKQMDDGSALTRSSPSERAKVDR